MPEPLANGGRGGGAGVRGGGARGGGGRGGVKMCCGVNDTTRQAVLLGTGSEMLDSCVGREYMR